jgi:mRNA interferase YafQ
MRTIDYPSSFKRDYKREKKGPHRAMLDVELEAVLEKLVVDSPLTASQRDHSLGGDWLGHRECHIKPDLLLIYKKPDDNKLVLVRLGSHSELFG